MDKTQAAAFPYLRFILLNGESLDAGVFFIIIYVDEHEEKEKCIYCGYINFVEEAINNSSPNNSYYSKRIRCVCGHTMTIPANHDRMLYCPRCGMQIYVKGMARIDIQGDSHREVLEVGQKMLNQSHTLVKQAFL